MKWIRGNRASLLSSGEEFLKIALKEINEAESEIIFETYIFKADRVGLQIAAALKRAAGRGVEISLVVDGVGSMNTSDEFFADLRRAGIHVIIFRLFRRWPLLGSLALRRLHRKSITFDGRRCIVGGMNIADDQINTPEAPGKLDLSLLAEGPVVKRVRFQAKKFIYQVTHQWLEWLRFIRHPQTSAVVGSTEALYLIRDNIGHRRRLPKFYLEAIDQAQNEILIASAYFVPHRKLRVRLKRAIQRGVKVTILIQGLTDSPIAYHASRPHLRGLLKHGVRLVEIRDRVLHAKAALIDDDWVTVGSFNWEPFSIFLNLEGNIFLKDADLAAKLRSIFLSWENAHGHILQNSDLDLSLYAWIQTQVARFIYAVTRWIGRYPFD